jgi:hypothetical protein
MRLQLQRFDFRLVYKPGKELFIADTLSRAHLPALFADKVTKACQEQVHTVLDHIILLRDTRSRYAKATADDPALQLVKELLLSGWPEKKSHCPIPARPFWNVRHSLTEVDGLILFGKLLVVPVSLRRETMEGVHFGNFCKVKSVRRAKFRHVELYAPRVHFLFPTTIRLITDDEIHLLPSCRQTTSKWQGVGRRTSKADASLLAGNKRLGS